VAPDRALVAVLGAGQVLARVPVQDPAAEAGAAQDRDPARALDLGQGVAPVLVQVLGAELVPAAGQAPAAGQVLVLAQDLGNPDLGKDVLVPAFISGMDLPGLKEDRTVHPARVSASRHQAHLVTMWAR
jgi:hypothetical protein